MMLDRIKKEVSNNLNVTKKFMFHGSRNQIEEFEGIISAVYPAVFVITIDGNKLRSFSYSDLLIGNLKIIN
jgi:uncharacterized protein Veg